MQINRVGSKAVATAMLVAAFAAPVMAADTIKVVTGHGVWDSYVTEAAVNAGFFKDRDPVVEFMYSSGSGETLQAVLSGAADVGEVGTLGVFSAYLKGAPVRIIGAEATGSSEFWYARTDSGINSLKDTDGKTIAFSSTGSSTNSVVRGFISEYGLKVKPVATGSPAATLTAVMSGQIDVGWASPPFGLKEIDEGKIKIIGRGNDLPTMRNQTIRVIITNADALKNKRQALQRYMDARAKTVDLMYGPDPEPLRGFAVSNRISEEMAQRVREFYPKSMLIPDEIKGLNELMDEAVSLKFVPAPLTAAQLSELIQVVTPRRSEAAGK